MPLPKSINELDKLSQEYLKSLDQANHGAATEKYLDFVENAVKNSYLEEEEYDSEENTVDISDHECDEAE